MCKDEISQEIKCVSGYDPESYGGYYGNNVWKKDTLLALRTIFLSLNLRVSSLTQCCLTKQQMAFQLEQAYSACELKFTSHEINYISRKGFIILYNTLIEGTK